MNKKELTELNKGDVTKLTTILQGNRTLDSGPFYHGTKADLKTGDLLEPGYGSNYGKRKKANYVYLTATIDAAKWGAELAVGDGPGRIYRVVPTGIFEDDPNLTDKKFPGNPTRSYRTQHPLQFHYIASNKELPLDEFGAIRGKNLGKGFSNFFVISAKQFSKCSAA